MKKGLVSSRGFQKLTKGHPWVMAADIEDKKSLPSRSGLTFFGEHWFFHSPESQIRLRRFGPSSRNWKNPGSLVTVSDGRQFIELFGEWLQDHLQKTFLSKWHLTYIEGDDLALRWIFSENDLIPGLTLDVLGSVIVADITTAPIEHFWLSFRPQIEQAIKTLSTNETLPTAIREQLKSVRLIESRGNEIRRKEGLELIALEDSVSAQWLKWNGLQWQISAASEQKTGFYLDQKFNHSKAAEWARRLGAKTALDLFTFQGGFALHLAKAGVSTLALDQSSRALEVADLNRGKNEISSDLLKFEKADIFEWLKAHNKKYDVIVLDPPALSKSKENLDKTVRALVGLHARAFELLNEGGLLVTCTCSQAITDEILMSVLREAAHQTRRTTHILERSGPSPDHAPLPGFEEGDYLKAWFVKAD